MIRNLMSHELRHKTNNNLTSPFWEIERKLKNSMKTVSTFYDAKKLNRKKNHTKSLSPVFLTFVFKESFYDLSLFLKV